MGIASQATSQFLGLQEMSCPGPWVDTGALIFVYFVAMETVSPFDPLVGCTSGIDGAYGLWRSIISVYLCQRIGGNELPCSNPTWQWNDPPFFNGKLTNDFFGQCPFQ